jgi:branched-chain amino acid transport system permease protein
MMSDLILQLLVSGLLVGGIYALISVGLTLVFGVLRVVNFAHGEYLTIAMYSCFFLWRELGIDPYIAAVVVIPFLFILGVMTERLLIRPTLEAPHVVQVFITFALSIWLQNLFLMMFSSDFLSVRTESLSQTFTIGSVHISLLRCIAFVAAMALAAGLIFFLQYSNLGRAIRATAQNRRSARLAGVDVDRVYAITFGLGCALAGAAGVLLAPIFPVNPYTGAEMILVAFVVVVLGGFGSVVGAVVAGLLLGMIESLSGFFLGSEMKQLVYFVFFIIVLAIRPTGFFGRKGSEVMEVT